jgi:hypothetical protein
VKHIRKRITYANVMSSIAVFLVLGGATAYAAKKIGSNEIKGNSITTGKIKKNAVTASKIKKNSIITAKIKNGAVTGPKINLSTLGTVPSANTANTANTANNLNGFKVAIGAGGDETVTTLFSTGQFDVVGICDPAETLTIPGFDNGYNTRHGSAIGIINRGQDNGVAETSDDEDEDFNVGDGVAFDYLDVVDVGAAVLPNGHWIHVLGGLITEAGINPAFANGCTFHSLVYFG